MGDREKAFLARAPKWREQDIEAINALFRSYIFIRRKTGEVWTTCCRKHAVISDHHDLWLYEHAPEPRPVTYCHMGAMSAPRPTEDAPCPFCGKKGRVKELRYTGRRKNLWEERRFVILRWYRGALWALAAWAEKDYEMTDRLTDAPKVRSGAAYRFGKTAVGHVGCHWYCCFSRYEELAYKDFRKTTVDRPFSWTHEDGNGYDLIGLDELEKSAVRYCRLDRYKGDILKALHLAFVYPRQVEMLMKAGMEDVVYDLAERGVKHARVLDWTQTDPKKAWKVTGAELRDFLDLTTPERRPVGMLELYRTLRREDARFTVRDADDIYEMQRYDIHTLTEKAKEWGLPAYKLWRYLLSTGLDPQRAFYAWKDYTRMAQELGYPMHRENVLLPRDLGEAHDRAVKEHQKQADRIRKEKDERERRARAEGYEAIKAELKRLYEIEAGGYLICVPESEEEIVAEGKALQHCVGGYAKRHAEGKTVILFLRDAGSPEKPYITIEMDGQKLRQIHGFKNESCYTAGGRFAPDPRETFRWLLDPWLDWIRRGSRRNKDGSPKGLHIMKEAKTA